jgi:integrase
MPKAKPAKKYKGYLFKRGSVYWLQYSSRNADGKVVRLAESLQTTNKVEAEAKAVEITAPLLHSTDLTKLERVLRERVASTQEQVDRFEADKNRTLLTDVWQKFPYDMAVRGNARRPLKPKVVIKHRQLWQAFVNWTTANRPQAKYIESITSADANAYSDYCHKIADCGPRGHNDRIKICRVVCELAGQNPNPFASVRKWSETNEGRDALELIDLQRIVTAATGELRLLIMIGLFTGLRLGDAVLLSWQDIKDGRVYKVTSKNSKPVSLGIAPALAAELAALPRPSNNKDFIMPELAALYAKEPQRLCKKIRRLFESVGIEVVEHVPGRAKGVSRRGFHSLRTSFVSICARAGVPTELISQWAGHSPQVNAIYQKFGNKERDDRILGALDKIATTALPISTPAPIDVEAIEVQYIDTIRAEIIRRLESADQEKMIKILAMF